METHPTSSSWPRSHTRGSPVGSPLSQSSRCLAAQLVSCLHQQPLLQQKIGLTIKRILACRGLRLLTQRRQPQVRPASCCATSAPLSAQTCNYLQFCTCRNPHTITFLVSWGLQTVRQTPFQSQELRAEERGAATIRLSPLFRRSKTVARRKCGMRF